MHKIYPKTLFIGQNSQFLPSCQSTNDIAADSIAQESASEGFLILTDHQTAGKGQRGNAWAAEPGQNLLFSLILRPTFLTASEQFWLNMAVSLGITDTLLPLIGSELRIKWPNDVYVANQKLGGILIENTLQGYTLAWAVVGVGLNINQTAFAYPTATSLQQCLPQPGGHNRLELLTQLCETLEARYLQLRSGRRDSMRVDYLQRLFRYQETHTFVADDATGQPIPFQGVIVGVDATGRLAIQTEETLRYFGFKEVQFVV